MNLTGQPICILDLETEKSADDCRHCGQDVTQHYADGACAPWEGEWPPDTVTQFSALGWNNKPALGLSIGCFYDYRDSRMHWFDAFSLEATMRHFIETQPLLVSFNGIGFDSEIMLGVLCERIPATDLRWGAQGSLNGFIPAWVSLWSASYDILAECWRVDPSRKFEPGLNSLNAISQANGFGAKEMDGATAPRLWAQGRYAEVLNYCQGDVIKTRQLFEEIMDTGVILRGDGQPIRLRNPLDLVEA